MQFWIVLSILVRPNVFLEDCFYLVNQSFTPIFSPPSSAMLVSIPFLIITLLLYLWLPALNKNVHGKCFICYSICQSACFIVESVNYYTNGATHLDSIVIYLFLCSFQWLNVTAFDAWWNLRTFK